MHADSDFVSAAGGKTGGLMANGSTVNASNCSFKRNKAWRSLPTGNGGAVSAVLSRLECRACTFRDNSAIGCAASSM
jgi:hypothetical protein